MSEYSTHAFVDGERLEVVVAYETDGFQPMIYGIFAKADDEDLTLLISEDQFDRIREEVSQHIIECMTESAERKYAEDNDFGMPA
jgi:predicted transcriptional regulator